MESHDSKIQDRSILLLTLDGTNIQEVVVRVYAILKSGFVASSVYDPATENLRRFEHLRVRNHVVASETKNCNELLHQFLDQVLDVVRVLSIFSRFSKQENTFRHYHR